MKNEEKIPGIRVLNFGSILTSHTYRVDRFILPDSKIKYSGGYYQLSPGGKGLNQSIALAQAGAEVYHAGRIGKYDIWLKEMMNKKGVDATLIETIDMMTDNAIVQVDSKGENLIAVFGKMNHSFAEKDILRALRDFNEKDYLLVQNETNLVSEIILAGKAKGMKIVFNPAPMTPEVLGYPLESVDIFFMNQSEAYDLTGSSSPLVIYKMLAKRSPKVELVLTIGRKGAYYFGPSGYAFQTALPVQVADTTGAGDTLNGFFLSEYIRTGEPKASLAFAIRAAAISVSRHGAADSIPSRKEVEYWT